MTSAIDRVGIVNRRLGWGEPKDGLWFIGVEAGDTWTEAKVAAITGSHNLSKAKSRKGDPVPHRTATIVSHLIGFPSVAAYRDEHMWLHGSKIFSGNLLPVGKPRRTSEWPKEYPELFGFNAEEYEKHFETTLKRERYEGFKELRKEQKPQAIVCFGKSHWSEFETVFVNNPSDRTEFEEVGVRVYKQDCVLLTRHFAYGRHMTHKSVAFVVRTLTEWGVTLPVPRQ